MRGLMTTWTLTLMMTLTLATWRTSMIFDVIGQRCRSTWQTMHAGYNKDILLQISVLINSL